MKMLNAKKITAILTGSSQFLPFMFLLPLLFNGAFLTTPEPPIRQSEPPAQDWSDSENNSFLPVIAHFTTIDLTIGALEITQGIQDTANSVPLIAGKPAVIRIFAETNTVTPFGPVSLSVSASRGGQALPNSPVVTGPFVIPLTWSRGEINSSANVRVPAEWLSGSVEMQVQVDPGDSVWEIDESNNTQNFSASFTQVPALDVRVVPINYIGINGTYPAPTSWPYIESWLRKIYPTGEVLMSRRANFEYDGPLETIYGWNELLDNIWLLRQSDHAPAARIYYGLIPVESGGRSWLIYGEGILGNGFVGARAAIGVVSSSNYGTNGGTIAGHEIGHTLGRWHSPCGAPPGTMDNYPYPEAAIANYGLDVTDLSQFTLIPPTHKDIMSYCSPVWVSDFSFETWLDSQLGLAAVAAELPERESLLVRARLSIDGSVNLLPSYVFKTTPEKPLPQGEYTVELVSAGGEVIASQHASLLSYADTNGEQSIAAQLPLPDQPFEQIRIRRSPDQRLYPGEQSEIIVVSDINTGGLTRQTTVELISTSADITLRWGSPRDPAIIRYTVGEDPEITTIVLDWRGGELTMARNSLPQGTIHFEILLADQVRSILTTTWENTRH